LNSLFEILEEWKPLGAKDYFERLTLEPLDTFSSNSAWKKIEKLTPLSGEVHSSNLTSNGWSLETWPRESPYFFLEASTDTF
jgi:hypothetical protein